MPNLAWFFLFCKLKDASDIQSDAVLNMASGFTMVEFFFQQGIHLQCTTGYLRTYY